MALSKFVLTWGLLGWALLGLSVLLFVSGWCTGGFVRKGLVCMASAVLGLSAVEIWSYWTAPTELDRGRGGDHTVYVRGDRDLGYSAIPDSEGMGTLHLGTEEIYSTKYRFDRNGTRRLPEIVGEAAVGSILCFGGSFMLGEGLQEDEALPAQLAEQLAARGGAPLLPVNFGLHGWGPHQMLALVQSGRLEEMGLPEPKAAVYWAIEDHVHRALGLRWFDRDGPLFQVDSSGKAVRAGAFHDLPGRPLPDPHKTLGAKISWFLRRRAGSTPKLTAEQIATWAAIVETARQELTERYPGIEFHVLVEDRGGWGGGHVLEELSGGRIKVHRETEIIDGFGDDLLPWVIHPEDLHPNARAVDRLAEYLAAQLDE